MAAMKQRAYVFSFKQSRGREGYKEGEGEGEGEKERPGKGEIYKFLKPAFSDLFPPARLHNLDVALSLPHNSTT